MPKAKGWKSDATFGVIGAAAGAYISVAAPMYQTVAPVNLFLAFCVPVIIFALMHAYPINQSIDKMWQRIGQIASGAMMSYVLITAIMQYL